MIEVQTKIKIPFLWGKSVFDKKNWQNINLIVGPNGSGKSLLAEEIANQFEKANYEVNFLRLDRDATSDDFSILKSDEQVRTKIEEILSNMFSKSIRFEQKDDGTYVPMVQHKTWNLEYDLHDRECHGLKGILKLLTTLYTKTSDNRKCVLMIDEPELHLHPQFQLFFINEIRKIVQGSDDKIIFLITHSPFFIDLRNPEDLLGVVACHVDRSPTFIEQLSDYDFELLRKFLPRLNSYHKQFFFSDNQIFVEGYTDQQIFTKLLQIIDNSKGTAGTGIIDVGGKDELGVFFKVCSLLGTNARVITDLDSLFQSKLREEVCSDERAISWLEKQNEKQIPFYEDIFTKKELNHKITLEILLRKLEKMIVQVGNSLCEIKIDNVDDYELCILLEKLHLLMEKHENVEAIDTFKTVILQGILNLGEQFSVYLPLPIAQLLPRIKNLVNIVFAAFEASRVYILNKGCIEHYYTQNEVFYMPVSGKDKMFHSELSHIESADALQIHLEYESLIEILERACRT